MVDVVMIHGIHMHRSLRSTMHEQWGTAAVEGLRNIRSSYAESFSMDCAFYGHEYNDGKSWGEPAYTSIDVEPGLETELLVAIGGAVGVEWARRAEETKVYLPGTVQRALAALQRSRLFEGRDSLVISFVKQVSRYFEDAAFRDRVHGGVSAAMSGAPRLVVGHSLGSVVAYNWLRANEVDRPPALITLGSPLGFEAIRRRVQATGAGEHWPGRTRSWTNIAAGHDAVAMVKHLRPLYSPAVSDLPCDNPRTEAHSALRYLSNVRTSRAIDAALART